MNAFYYAIYRYRLSKVYPERYGDLMRVFHRARCRRILEIGTHNGVNARRLIETARIRYAARQIEYHGLDLFEMLTPEMLKSEFSIQPPTRAEVDAKLRPTGANVRLYQGFSQEILPKIVPTLGAMDLVFIDGGHSFETIESDWRNVQPVIGEKTVVVFDDYICTDDPHVQGFGCQSLIRSLDPNRHQVTLLPHIDEFKHDWGVLRTRMVSVTLKLASK